MAVKASEAISLSCVVDVYSTTRYYLLQASTQAMPTKPTQNPPGGSWSDTEPSYTSGSTNTLYFTDLTVFSDGTWAYSGVSVSSAYEAAKQAYNEALSASQAVTTLNNSLTQQEIFNRLTNNGAAQGMFLNNGQVYVSASYINSGTINGTNVNAKLLNIVDANNNVIASFNNVIVLGQSNKAHAEMRQNLFAIVNQNGDTYFQAGAFGDTYTIEETIQSDGPGQHEFDTMFNIAEVSSLTFNGEEVPPSEFSFDGNTITLLHIAANVATVVVQYTTDDPAGFFSLGTRKDGSDNGLNSVAEGCNIEASGKTSHSEGYGSTSSNDFAHSEGYKTTASGIAAHSEGFNTTASGDYSHAEGRRTTASGGESHAEGYSNIASGDYAHTEGIMTQANSTASHAEGWLTHAHNQYAHSEGYTTTASGEGSHSEGEQTTASGDYSHAEGAMTTASGAYSHAEGSHTTSSGGSSHAEGYYTIAAGTTQHVFGKYNISDNAGSAGVYVEMVGNGTSDSSRSNARTLDWSGNEWIAGALSVGNAATTRTNIGAFGASDVATLAEIKSELGIQ